MSSIIPEKYLHKAQFNYKCLHCGKEIPKGTLHFSGWFFGITYHMHIQCAEKDKEVLALARE